MRLPGAPANGQRCASVVGGLAPGYPGGDIPGAGKGIRYMSELKRGIQAKGDVGAVGGAFVAAADVGGAMVASGGDVWLAGGVLDAPFVSPDDLSFSPCE